MAEVPVLKVPIPNMRIDNVGLGAGVGAWAVAGGALGLGLLALAAPWLAHSSPSAALAIRAFFSGLCHQDPARSFAVDGAPVAVCVRCLGIYIGVAAGAMLTGAMLSGWLRRLDRLAVHLFVACLLLNGVDVAAETLHLPATCRLCALHWALCLVLPSGWCLLCP